MRGTSIGEGLRNLFEASQIERVPSPGFSARPSRVAADGDAGGGRDTRALVASVREDLLDEGERAARGGQQRARPIAILHAGGMHADREQHPDGVGQQVALAADDLLARVVERLGPVLDHESGWIGHQVVVPGWIVGHPAL